MAAPPSSAFNRITKELTTFHASGPCFSCFLAVLLSSEKNLLHTDVPNKTLSWSISYERKIPYLIFTYIPIYEKFKVNRFRYSVNLTFQEIDIVKPKNNSTNSVLSSGDWYKIKLSNDGLYKINADFWLVENSYHVDAMFKYPEVYSKKMEDFFNKNLK